MAKRPSHYDSRGRARMVDVGAKPRTNRKASARALMRMSPDTCAAITEGRLPKGDAIAVARTAGIMAAKQTPALIPLCHQIALSSVNIDFDIHAEAGEITITATAAAADRTGVEMEAITAAAVAAITIYDMCKSLQKDIEIASIALVRKSGGRSGDYSRKPD